MKKRLITILAISFVCKLSAQVGINTSTPKATLDIVAKESGKGFRLQDGNQANNKVLASDANGVGTWKDLNLLVTDNNFKLARVYSVQLNLTSASDVNRNLLLGTLPSVEVVKPDNFIICYIQSPATIVNNTLQSIAYNFRLFVNNVLFDTAPLNIISNTGFADATQTNPYSFYLSQYPVGYHRFDINVLRLNSIGSNASSRPIYFNAVGNVNDGGVTAIEKKGLAIVYVYEK